MNVIDILLNEQYQFVSTERLQSDPGGWASIARWVMGFFQYRPSATSENIENHEPSERMMMHQSIRQKSKDIREP